MTSSQTRILTTGFAVLSAFALTALINVPAAHAQIKIGVFGPMSGDAAAYGTSERNNVELAVKEKNAAGGLLGQKVEAVYGDDGGKPEQAVSVAKRLTGDDGVVILRARDFSCCITSRSLYERANGYNYEAVKIFMAAGSKQPVVVHYVEHMPPDVTAC